VTPGFLRKCCRYTRPASLNGYLDLECRFNLFKVSAAKTRLMLLLALLTKMVLSNKASMMPFYDRFGSELVLIWPICLMIHDSDGFFSQPHVFSKRKILGSLKRAIFGVLKRLGHLNG
jgi:hypothetical protein